MKQSSCSSIWPTEPWRVMVCKPLRHHFLTHRHFVLIPQSPILPRNNLYHKRTYAEPTSSSLPDSLQSLYDKFFLQCGVPIFHATLTSPPSRREEEERRFRSIDVILFTSKQWDRKSAICLINRVFAFGKSIKTSDTKSHFQERERP